MSLNQENIIKDKLLDHEIPFEEEYWADFKEKLDNDQKSKPIGGIAWLKSKLFAIGAGIALVSILFLKTDKDSSIAATFDNETSNQEQLIGDNSSTTNSSANTNINNSNNNQSINSENTIAFNSQNEVNNSENELNSTDLVNIGDSKKNNQTNGSSIANNQTINNRKGNKNRNKSTNNKQVTRNEINNTKGKTNVNNQIDNLGNKETITNNFGSNNVNASNNISNVAQAGPSGSGIFVSTPEYIEGTKEYSNIDAVTNNQVNTYNSSGSNDVLTSLEDINNVDFQNTFTNDLVALASMDFPGVELPKNNKFEAHNSSEKTEWSLPRIKRWEIGAYAGIGLNIPTKYGELASDYNIKGSPNITAGFYFNYALNKNLSVETALQYKRIVDIFAMRVNFEDGVELVKFTETSVVSRLNSFEIPMGINYKLNDWLYISTGVSVAYVRPSQGFIDVKEVENLNGSNIDDFYVLAKEDNFGLRKVDVRAYAGLTFNVSPFIGFKFLINQGLIDRTKNDYYNTKHYNLHTDYTFSTVIRLNSKVLK